MGRQAPAVGADRITGRGGQVHESGRTELCQLLVFVHILVELVVVAHGEDELVHEPQLLHILLRHLHEHQVKPWHLALSTPVSNHPLFPARRTSARSDRTAAQSSGWQAIDTGQTRAAQAAAPTPKLNTHVMELTTLELMASRRRCPRCR